jgi:O-antigen/teichoic acid export membrane protein
MFGRDFTSYMAFMPVLFFAGVLYVCFYIIMLVGSLENNSTRNADRYDLAYRIVFSVTLFVLIIRSFLGDFMGEGTTLNVSYEIIIVAIVSGIATWLTPKIKDNDNTEF